MFSELTVFYLNCNEVISEKYPCTPFFSTWASKAKVFSATPECVINLRNGTKFVKQPEYGDVIAGP